MKRVKDTVNPTTATSSQMDTVVSKVRPKLVKSEVIINEDQDDGNQSGSDSEDDYDYSVDPFKDIKSQYDNDDDESSNQAYNIQNEDYVDDSNHQESSPVNERKRPRKQSFDHLRMDISNPVHKNPNEVTMKVTEPKVKKKETQKSPCNSMSKRKSRSGTDFFVCHLCDIKFNNKLKRFHHDETIHLEGAHDMVESSTTRLYSSICGKSSLIPGELSAHNETFHPEQFKFICTLCKRVPSPFTSLDILKAHQVIHKSARSRVLACILCKSTSLTFSSTIDLDNHLRRVHFHGLERKSKVHRVGPECENTPNASDYRLKRRTVESCRFCGSRPRRGLMGVREHEKSNHPEKFINICNHPNCGEAYAEANELVTCQETHKKKTSRGQRQFKCFVCNGRFKDSLTLREHLDAKHTKGGYKCELCFERLATLSEVAVHKVKVHGGGGGRVEDQNASQH